MFVNKSYYISCMILGTTTNPQARDLVRSVDYREEAVRGSPQRMEHYGSDRNLILSSDAERCKQIVFLFLIVSKYVYSFCKMR